MRFPLLLAVAAAGLATACASMPSTAYQAANAKNPYRYSEQQLESNRMRLTFSGNSQTELATVKKYVLFRAAETTLQRGYDYFVFVDRGFETEVEYRVSGPIRPRFGGGEIEQSGASYEAMADVTMFKGAKPALLPNAYDAREVKANLELGIQRPTIS